MPCLGIGGRHLSFEFTVNAKQASPQNWQISKAKTGSPVLFGFKTI
jgi:hypothetical protein